MGFASPKSIQKTAPLRSQNFVNKGFFGVRGKNAANPFGFASILTMSQHKILVLKSVSSLNALARRKKQWLFVILLKTATPF